MRGWQPIVFSVVMAATMTWSAAARSEQGVDPTAGVARTACPAPEGALKLRDEEVHDWSACEKWVWSCIAQGREANLFVRRCTVPRTTENDDLRTSLKDLAFEEPARFASSNALSGNFLLTILWQPV